MSRLWERWGSSLGVLAIVLWVVAFLIAGNTPDTKDENAKLISWYASNSHQRNQIIGFLAFGAGVLLLAGFLGALRDRLVASEGAPFRLSTLAFGCGIASLVLWMVGVIGFTVPAFVASDSGSDADIPGIYRSLSAMGYEAWIVAGALGAVMIWAVSALALRTGVLPRWFAWLGVVAGVVLLFGFVFLPLFVFWGWVVIASVLLTISAPAVAPAGGSGTQATRPLSEPAGGSPAA